MTNVESVEIPTFERTGNVYVDPVTVQIIFNELVGKKSKAECVEEVLSEFVQDDISVL